MGFAVTGLDHVQLAMPPGGEAAAETFSSGPLGLARIAGSCRAHDPDGGGGDRGAPDPDRPPGTGCYVDDPFGNRIELIDADWAGAGSATRG